MREYIIGIIPSDAVVGLAIAVSRVLGKRGGLFVLNRQQERPHVTLYYCVLPRGAVRIVEDRIAKVAKRVLPFDCVATSIHSDEWVNVGYRRSRKLLELHRDIIRVVNPLRRDILREKDRVRLTTVGKCERENILRYGYRFADSLYRPHLTFSRLSNSRTHVVIPERAQHFTFRANSIGIFGAGAHGTCVRLLKKFPLRGSA